MEVLYQLSYPGTFWLIEPKSALLEVEPPNQTKSHWPRAVLGDLA
jgi:hypothetical protein